MRQVFIVGGDGFARECYNNLIHLPEYGKEVEFGGFLGHGGYGHTVDYKSYQHLYKGEVAEHEFKDNEYCIIGAAYPELRKKIYDDLKKMNCKFYNLICKDVFISPSVEVGEANVICGGTILTCDIKIGCGNVMNGRVTIGHDSEIGNFNFFGPCSQLLGYIKVGNYNEMAVSSILLPKAKIGNNNKIAPMSVVYKGCKNNCYMAGNPALKVGEV